MQKTTIKENIDYYLYGITILSGVCFILTYFFYEQSRDLIINFLYIALGGSVLSLIWYFYSKSTNKSVMQKEEEVKGGNEKEE